MDVNVMDATSQQQPLLQVVDLAIGYRNQRGAIVQVLRGIDLTIHAGETVGLVGESGSGKSTLALAMLGYLRRGSQLLDGSIHFAGLDLFCQTPQQLTALRGKQIALIPQNAGQALTPTIRIGKQIEEALFLHTNLTPHARSLRVGQLLSQVRLPAPDVLTQRYPHQLSGGQQQRVAIAMALAGEPQLLLLDEPTTGLDVTTQAHLLVLLQEIAQTTQTAIVYVSHDLGVIARVSDRVAVMYASEIVETGTCAEVLRQPKHPYTRGLLASTPRLHSVALIQALPGTPPPLGTLAPGCAFAQRCAWADQQCEQVAPRLETIPEVETATRAQSHQVRCHHWQTLVPYHTRTTLYSETTSPATELGSGLLQLQDLEISYYKPSLAARWFKGNGAPPATVSDISFRVRKGETLALVGESGSGKSTLVKAIAGLLTPRRGQMGFAGLPLPPQVEQRPAELRRRIQLIFQNPAASLNPRHTVAELLAQPLRLYWGLGDAQRRARTNELLHLVRLGEHYHARFPAQLSGGEKQRVAIARAFAANPDLILCDEVTSSLDVSVQAAVLDLLRNLQTTQQATYIFISHDLALVRTVADQVAVLYQGRLCEIGPVAAIYAPPFHPYTATLLQAVLEPEPGARPQLATKDVSEAAPPARGCPFQNRCIHHLGAICATETPPWQISEPGGAAEHKIRCHLSWPELVARQAVQRIVLP